MSMGGEVGWVLASPSPLTPMGRGENERNIQYRVIFGPLAPCGRGPG